MLSLIHFTGMTMTHFDHGKDSKPTARQVAAALNRTRAGQKASMFSRSKSNTDQNAAPDAEQSHARRPAQHNAVPEFNYGAAAYALPSRFVPTKRETMRFLFSPQIGMSLQGMTQSVGILVRTFTLLLISVNLLPKNHPAATMQGAQSYSLFNVIGEAGRNLHFTRNHAPQIAVFLSIIAFLFSSVICLGLIFLKFAFGVAFAQDAGVTTGAVPLVDNGDIASNLLTNIFDTENLSRVVPGINQMLSAYSYAVLILAGLILLFIVLSAVAETARTGTPFGKQFNPVWAPIRLIVALGLLIPLSGGLNSGQHMILGVTKWGSQRATDIWANFATRINSSQGALTSVPRSTKADRALIIQELVTQVCQEVQSRVGQSNGVRSGQSVETERASIEPIIVGAGASSSSYYSPTFKLSFDAVGAPNGKGACGGRIFSANRALSDNALALRDQSFAQLQRMPQPTDVKSVADAMLVSHYNSWNDARDLVKKLWHGVQNCKRNVSSNRKSRAKPSLS